LYERAIRKGEIMKIHFHVDVYTLDRPFDLRELLTHDRLRAVELVLADDSVRFKIGDSEAWPTTYE
jgi:hypothetical protein